MEPKVLLGVLVVCWLLRDSALVEGRRKTCGIYGCAHGVANCDSRNGSSIRSFR